MHQRALLPQGFSSLSHFRYNQALPLYSLPHLTGTFEPN
jgi:hypothetical protein